MPCFPLKTKDSVGFICTRSTERRQKCYRCGKPAVSLCDYRGMESIYETDRYGHRIGRMWVPSLHQCSRPMCISCRTHVGPDEDYCELHSSEYAIMRSRKAEALFTELCKERGIDTDSD